MKLSRPGTGALLDRKAVVSWALYDWANSGFAVTVISAFFPLFLKQYWSAGDDPTVSTFRLGIANSTASIVVAVLSPVLGAIADCGSAKKRHLVVLTALAIVMTGALPLVSRGDWLLAIVLFVVASIGFSAGNIFYDALIVEVAHDERLHYASALGFSLGYLGGGLLFAANVAMTLWPQKFGLADAAEAVRVSFALVAVWWAVFTVPLLLFVKETPSRQPAAGWTAVREGLRELAETFHQLRALRPVWIFLLAYWCYIDGVHTIARMAVDYGMALGFEANSLIVALLITQFVGFPAALAFGYAGERLGAKPAIFAGIAAYLAATLWSYFMTEVWEFYVLAVAIGLVQGGVQSLSRSFYARIIPAGQAGEFFGFYNMLGKFAAVLGPVLIGVGGALSGSPRLAILAIVVLFIAGALLLSLVRERDGVRSSQAAD
ncbi:MAG: MFS transporter [Betaproteobacteria bacterium]|nr:MFS transporter [Betaproteobacteria bacterium]MBI2960329.1 MFS transporter [Betaproteobacteria bacterium]